MTAVIGILNKHGAAIAADSAVTINGPNGRKILNSANKIFTLSKHYPVGVMIYNSADFMTTPWEVIIKSYRKSLGSNEHNTVEEYSRDFISYLRSKGYYTDSEFQKSVLKELFSSISTMISNDAINDALKDTSSVQLDASDAVASLQNKIEELHSQISDDGEYCDDFSDYTFEEFNAYSSNIFEEILDQIFTSRGLDLSHPYISKLQEILFEHIRSKHFLSYFTGLIFVGYGKEEVYPSLVPLNISGVFDNRLRYFVEENKRAHITNRMSSAIRPFAQTDVIDTILSGVDPELSALYINQLESFFVKYNEIIASIINSTNGELANRIRNIQPSAFIEEYTKQIEEVKQKRYISPLMDAVDSLSKADLSEMAESLIYLTYLKRRITFAEESVGGPVDVALISKGDGFIWMKRKHYFQPELNHHFFANYIKKQIT